MKKILLLIFVFCIFISNVNAKNCTKNYKYNSFNSEQAIYLLENDYNKSDDSLSNSNIINNIKNVDNENKLNIIVGIISAVAILLLGAKFLKTEK